MTDFDEIYRLYAKSVYGFLMRMTASAELSEELTSETFYRAVKNINSFKGNCTMSVWLCSIAKNLYLDHLKKSERKNIYIEDDNYPDSADMTLHIEDKEQLLAVHRVLHALEEPYKEVFSLRIFGELSYKEIGELFGKKDSWARVIFFRAKEMIIRKINE
ncbi:MAG: sigma-70 family RNA polymerase sigma factor [Oscillospiraceae bacterium]|nr:sigma-70 family RNA polymerase sigma factor [Oscillospiraceae bacterium]